jgi:hypothetical protein
MKNISRIAVMRLSFAWFYGVHSPANDQNQLRFANRGP